MSLRCGRDCPGDDTKILGKRGLKLPTGEMKGIAIRIDAELHAEIKTYLEAHEITMGDFIALAAQDELYPKIQEEESKSMENIRTLAVSGARRSVPANQGLSTPEQHDAKAVYDGSDQG